MSYCIPLLSNSLHSIPVHFIPPHSTRLHHTPANPSSGPLHPTPLIPHHNSAHSTQPYSTPLHHTSPHRSSLHSTPLHVHPTTPNPTSLNPTLIRSSLLNRDIRINLCGFFRHHLPSFYLQDITSSPSVRGCLVFSLCHQISCQRSHCKSVEPANGCSEVIRCLVPFVYHWPGHALHQTHDPQKPGKRWYNAYYIYWSAQAEGGDDDDDHCITV